MPFWDTCLNLLSEIKVLLGFHPNIVRARFAPLSPASGFPASIVPSFHHSMGIRLHPSGVNPRPGPLGPDSLHDIGIALLLRLLLFALLME